MNHPMDTIFYEIEKATESGLYFLAITVALTIPDICAALVSHNGNSDRNKYKAWCRKNLATAFPHLTDTDLYSLRCGVSHQGRFGHEKLRYDRVLFTFKAAALSGHNSPLEWPDIKYLLMDPTTFCQDIIAAARTWLRANESNENIRRNLERLVRFRPEGLLPRIQGVPIIA